MRTWNLWRAAASTVALVGAGLAFGCDSSPTVPETQQVVVRAYLYAGEPVDEVQIQLSVALTSSDTSAVPVNDAAATLIKAGKRYLLTATAGDSGYYHYAGNDLTVAVGDTFDLEVKTSQGTVTARTVVPVPPASVTIDSAVLTVPTFTPGTPGSGGPPSFGSFGQGAAMVHWANPNRDAFFVTIDNVDPNPQALQDSLAGRLFGRFRVITQPTDADSFRIQTQTLTQTGLHRVRVYRVNSEYAELYILRQQDTRDLNEPPTNIHGGLGIFTAFSSDSVFFTAKKEE